MKSQTFPGYVPASPTDRVGRHILLVDTNGLDLETYADVLESLGYAVTRCPSYEDALHLLHMHSYDLVIVDQGGPEFPARPVLEQLHRTSVRIPSLVTAASRNLNHFHGALSLGASDYLEKPIPPQILRQAVSAALPSNFAPAGLSHCSCSLP